MSFIIIFWLTHLLTDYVTNVIYHYFLTNPFTDWLNVINLIYHYFLTNPPTDWLNVTNVIYHYFLTNPFTDLLNVTNVIYHYFLTNSSTNWLNVTNLIYHYFLTNPSTDWLNVTNIIYNYFWLTHLLTDLIDNNSALTWYKIDIPMRLRIWENARVSQIHAEYVYRILCHINALLLSLYCNH